MDFPGGPVDKNPPVSMQGICVPPPVREDSTRREAIKPVWHDYRSLHALGPVSLNY